MWGPLAVSLLSSFIFSSFATVVCANNNRFIFNLYYSDAECRSPISLSAFNAGEPTNLSGGESSNGICSHEANCVHDADSEFCKEELNHTVTGRFNILVDDLGNIAECDSTNDAETQGECFIFEQKCVTSSLLPSCKGELLTRATLVNAPERIRNDNLIDGNFDYVSYMAFYEDPDCADWVGIRGIVTGERNMTIVDDSHTCADALACLYNPNGEFCTRKVPEDTKSVIEIKTKTMNGGRDVYQCNNDIKEGEQNDEGCQLITSECKPSPLPSCWFRWTSAIDLFSDPESYIVALDEEEENDDDHDDQDLERDLDQDHDNTQPASAASVLRLFNVVGFVTLSFLLSSTVIAML